MSTIKTGRAAVAAALLAVAGLLASAPAAANLVGDEIAAAGNNLAPATATIGAGIEFTGLLGTLDFDFDASTLTVSGNATSWGGFGDYVFSGFDTPILDFSILSNSGFSGTLVDNFGFTASSITLDMSAGAQSPPGSVLVFAITTQLALPEPASLLLLGAAVLGVLRRRCRLRTRQGR